MIIKALNVNKYKLCEFCTIPPTILLYLPCLVHGHGRTSEKTICGSQPRYWLGFIFLPFVNFGGYGMWENFVSIKFIFVVRRMKYPNFERTEDSFSHLYPTLRKYNLASLTNFCQVKNQQGVHCGSTAIF